MKHLLTLLSLLLFLALTSAGIIRNSSRFFHHPGPETTEITDSLPKVFSPYHADITGCRLDHEAALQSARFFLPVTRVQWEEQCLKLRREIMSKAGITIDSVLSFDYQGTGTTIQNGYTIRNFIFQTLPGVYATANIYIPNGRGPFPAVVNLNGHWPDARRCEQVQAVAHDLASNGYVCLCLDAFGAGERSTIPGNEEYHGASLGASLMNVGKSLMGIQVIHLPGILAWGDVSMAAALSHSNVRFIDPVTMSGKKITGEKLQQVKDEFEKMGTLCHRRGKTLFIE